MAEKKQKIVDIKFKDNKESQEALIRRIIREERANFETQERYTFQKHLQLFDGRNIQVGRTTGTKIGTATDQLLAFYGITPVNQPATVADPVGQANDLDLEARTAINAIIDRLQELGLIA